MLRRKGRLLDGQKRSLRFRYVLVFRVPNLQVGEGTQTKITWVSIFVEVNKERSVIPGTGGRAGDNPEPGPAQSNLSHRDTVPNHTLLVATFSPLKDPRSVPMHELQGPAPLHSAMPHPLRLSLCMQTSPHHFFGLSRSAGMNGRISFGKLSLHTTVKGAQKGHGVDNILSGCR